MATIERRIERRYPRLGGDWYEVEVIERRVDVSPVIVVADDARLANELGDAIYPAGGRTPAVLDALRRLSQEEAG